MFDRMPVHYIRSGQKNNDVVVTISGIKLNDGRVAFGFAYRSLSDPPSKERGKAIAQRRAVGMVHAAENGVEQLKKLCRTPKGDYLLKKYLGDAGGLVEQLHVNGLYYNELPARVSRILEKIDQL